MYPITGSEAIKHSWKAHWFYLSACRQPLNTHAWHRKSYYRVFPWRGKKKMHSSWNAYTWGFVLGTIGQLIPILVGSITLNTTAPSRSLPLSIITHFVCFFPPSPFFQASFSPVGPLSPSNKQNVPFYSRPPFPRLFLLNPYSRPPLTPPFSSKISLLPPLLYDISFVFWKHNKVILLIFCRIMLSILFYNNLYNKRVKKQKK